MENPRQQITSDDSFPIDAPKSPTEKPFAS